MLSSPPPHTPQPIKHRRRPWPPEGRVRARQAWLAASGNAAKAGCCGPSADQTQPFCKLAGGIGPAKIKALIWGFERLFRCFYLVQKQDGGRGEIIDFINILLN